MIARRMAEFPARARAAVLARTWAPYSHLFLVSDNPDWVLSWEMRELAGVAQRLGFPVETRPPWQIRRQSIFYASHFALLDPSIWEGDNRIGLAYFHGRLANLDPAFERCLTELLQHRDEISRIQVSHGAMRDFLVQAGISSRSIRLIPIGINLSYFPWPDLQTRREARLALNIPLDAQVIGSFQKDGVGWGDGAEPKLVKGPDVFLRTIELLRKGLPRLFVLLSGPARGYVKAGLERLGVPYQHRYLADYRSIGHLYHAIDAYIVASREEGGPKAVLESMASGAPLVTTRVGQAMDIVRHGQNGWMVDVEDAEGLAEWTQFAIEHSAAREGVLAEARRTAEQHSYDRQEGLWRDFFDGFVEPDRATLTHPTDRTLREEREH